MSVEDTISDTDSAGNLLCGPHIGVGYRGYNMPDGSILFGEDAAEQAAWTWMAFAMNKLADMDAKLDRILQQGMDASK